MALEQPVQAKQVKWMDTSGQGPLAQQRILPSARMTSESRHRELRKHIKLQALRRPAVAASTSTTPTTTTTTQASLSTLVADLKQAIQETTQAALLDKLATDVNKLVQVRLSPAVCLLFGLFLRACPGLIIATGSRLFAQMVTPLVDDASRPPSTQEQQQQQQQQQQVLPVKKPRRRSSRNRELASLFPADRVPTKRTRSATRRSLV